MLLINILYKLKFAFIVTSYFYMDYAKQSGSPGYPVG